MADRCWPLFRITRDRVNWRRSSECVRACRCYSRCWKLFFFFFFLHLHYKTHPINLLSLVWGNVSPTNSRWLDAGLSLQQMDTGKEKVALWMCVSLIIVSNTPVCLLKPGISPYILRDSNSNSKPVEENDSAENKMMSEVLFVQPSHRAQILDLL